MPYSQYKLKEKDLTNLMWGCVTTGTEWQFLKLKDNAISVHNQLLYLNQVPEVLGYLQTMIQS